MKKVSFVIPCYRSALTIGSVVDELRECMASLADGSAYVSSLLLYAGGAVTLMGFLLLRISAGLEAERDDGTIVGPTE